MGGTRRMKDFHDIWLLARHPQLCARGHHTPSGGITWPNVRMQEWTALASSRIVH